LNSHALTGTGT